MELSYTVCLQGGVCVLKLNSKVSFYYQAHSYSQPLVYRGVLLPNIWSSGMSENGVATPTVIIMYLYYRFQNLGSSIKPPEHPLHGYGDDYPIPGTILVKLLHTTCNGKCMFCNKDSLKLY